MDALVSSLIIGLCTFLVLMILNTILAVAIHFIVNTFKWDEMLRFLKTSFAPYILIWFVFSLVNIGIFWLANYAGYDINIGSGFMTAIINFASLAITARLIKRIYEKLKVLKIHMVEKIKK